MARTIVTFGFIFLFLLVSGIIPAKGQDCEKKVDALIEPMVNQGLLGGVILIAEDGEKVFEKSYGYADREKMITNGLNTRFRISSVTKIFTALAIMQLFEKEQLDIYKPINRYFKDLPMGENITILHLLTHTSGIPGYNWRLSNNKPGTLAQVYEWIKKLPLKFKPGTDFFYSNSGYALLAMIVKKVSGLPYEKYLKKHILSPLGLVDTGLFRMNKSIKNLALGYSKSGYAPYRPAIRPAPLGQGDGDLYSTASDLLKLVNAFYSDKIVSKKYRKLMTTLHNERCGIGWYIKKNQYGTMVYHPGGSLGYISNLRIYQYQQGKKILISLFNSDFLLYSKVEKELENITLGKPFSPVFSKKKNQGYMEQLKPFLGEYRIEKEETFKIFVKNNNLVFQEKGFPECLAYIYEKDKIYIVKNNYRINFFKDDSGLRFRGLFGLYLVEGPKIKK
jgi:CubicO group peptidase (beta-lactamase class C family)